MLQWPDTLKFKINKSKFNFKKKVIEIENFFSKKYKTKYAVLSPSGRSSINTILNFFNFNRSKIVNIPLWTSACLVNSLGSFTNISVKNYKVDCNIIVHKWGYTFRIPKNLKKKLKKKLVIDDSADCLPNYNYKPFENNSNYEIVSLPKIIGSLCGGIILTNDKKFYKYCKKKQYINSHFSKSQTLKKYNSIFINKSNQDWRYYESFNHSVDPIGVNNIYECLKNFKINIDVIKKRKKIIKKNFKQIKFDTKRLGPCAIFEKKKYGKKFIKILEKKHFSFGLDPFKEKYSTCYIFPIHFGISNKKFKITLNKLIKIARKK